MKEKEKVKGNKKEKEEIREDKKEEMKENKKEKGVIKEDKKEEIKEKIKENEEKEIKETDK